MPTAPWGVAALSPNAPLYGSAGDDSLGGTGDADFFFLNDGGTDTVAGGDGDDCFYFGNTISYGDIINGGSGNDMLILQGTFVNAGFEGVQLSGIETILLMSASDTRFGASGTGAATYIVYLDETTVGAGQTLTIQGGKLGANEFLNVVGFNETDGNLRIIGGAGNDYLVGGGGADMICGGLGSDDMAGMGGNDVFVYRSTAESTVARPDKMGYLNPGDLIDLRLIDADTGSSGDQAFAFIGSDAFHNVAGELRVFGDSSSWTLQADTNGDGVADFAIAGQNGPPPLDASFFLL